MALTPSDVEQKTFSTALRGYDLDEVDDFLDEVVVSLRDLQDQLAEARTSTPSTTVVEPIPAPAPTPIDESALGRALVAAQETADQIVADAKAEAERILEEAKAEADSWSADRAAKKAEAEAEMEELASHVAQVRNQLAVLATAVADRLEEMDDAIKSDLGADEESAADDDEDAAEDPETKADGDNSDEGADDANATDEAQDEAPASDAGRHKPEVYVIGSASTDEDDKDE